MKELDVKILQAVFLGLILIFLAGLLINCAPTHSQIVNPNGCVIPDYCHRDYEEFDPYTCTCRIKSNRSR